MNLKKMNSINVWSDRSVDLAALILRLTLGLLMLGHGWPKLTKMLSGDFSFGNPIGIGEAPSLVMAVLAEFGCSILLIIGLKTRWALIPLVFTMLVILFRVLIPMDAPWERIESALYFLLPYIALFFLGSGRYSIDHMLQKQSVNSVQQ